VTTQTKTENGVGLPEMAGVLGTLAPSAQRALFGLAVAFRDIERDHAETVAGLVVKNEENRLEIETLEAENERLAVRHGELQRDVRGLREEGSELRAINEAFLVERAALRAKEAAAEEYDIQRRRVDDLLQAMVGALDERSGSVEKLAGPVTGAAEPAGAATEEAPADPGSTEAERRGGGEVGLGARRVPNGDSIDCDGSGCSILADAADPERRINACAADVDGGTGASIAGPGGEARDRPVTRSAQDPG
jgi:hypothetical protein